MNEWAWALGLFVSVVVGAVASGGCQWLHKRLMNVREIDDDPNEKLWRRRGTTILTGMLERALFTVLVASYGAPPVLVPMFAWLTLKMVTNRNSPLQRQHLSRDEIRTRLRLSLAALFAGLVSLGFALAGGAIWEDGCNGKFLKFVYSQANISCQIQTQLEKWAISSTVNL